MPAIGWPFQRTSPALGVARPQRIRSRLVLPLPLAPATRSRSPAFTASETPRKSVRVPRSHSSSAASSMRLLLQKAGSAPRLAQVGHAAVAADPEAAVVRVRHREHGIRVEPVGGGHRLLEETADHAAEAVVGADPQLAATVDVEDADVV